MIESQRTHTVHHDLLTPLANMVMVMVMWVSILLLDQRVSMYVDETPLMCAYRTRYGCEGPKSLVPRILSNDDTSSC